MGSLVGKVAAIISRERGSQPHETSTENKCITVYRNRKPEYKYKYMYTRSWTVRQEKWLQSSEEWASHQWLRASETFDREEGNRWGGEEIELSFQKTSSEQNIEKSVTAVQLTVIPTSSGSEVDCQGTGCQTRTLVCGELSYWGEGDARSYEIR